MTSQDNAPVRPLDAQKRAGSRSALMELLAIAAPTAATMASYTIAQFVDGLMVKELGPATFSAQNNGSVMVYSVIAVVMGITTVVNSFVAQHLGAERPEEGPSFAWNGLWICAIAWLFAMLPLGIFVEPAIASVLQGVIGVSESIGQGSPLSFPPEVVELQATYARILFIGGFFVCAARALSQFFFGLHRPGVVLVATVIGNVVNVALNYALIFGHFGLPALGIAGAAWGTMIGSAVEFLIPLALFLGPRLHARYATRAGWRPSLRRMREIFRVGWPAGLMYGNEVVCWYLLLGVMVAGLGAADNTASWIGLRYMQLSFMPTVGLATAVTAVVGRCMGMNRPDMAAHRARLGLGIACAYMGGCALIFLIFREPLVRLFIASDEAPEVAAEVLRIGTSVMIFAAVFQIFDAIGILLAGALRGAGDTVWPGVATAILSWTILIGGGWASLLIAPERGALGPWAAGTLYITVFAGAMSLRWLGGRWRGISLVRAGAGEEALRAPVGAGLAGEAPAGGTIAGEGLGREVGAESAPAGPR